MMSKVFISIIDFNGIENTVACLESLSKIELQDIDLGEVVVINNYPRKELILPQFRSLTVKVIDSQKNLGFSGGQNLGIRYALKNGADYVLVLNNDTLVHKKLLVQLIEVAKNFPDAGIFSPKIHFVPGFEFHKERYKKKDLGNVIWAAGGEIDWKNIYGKNRGVDEVDSGQYGRVAKVDFASGAAMLVRREVFEQIGFFDDDYFMYFEDVDFCVRAKKRGWNVLYVPEALVWHKVAQSSGIGSGLNDYYISRNRLAFGLRYASFKTKLALLRESFNLIVGGRKWQKVGVVDFYKGKYGKGSFPIEKRS